MAQLRKRKRSDEWVTFEPSKECSHIDLSQKVMFVDGFFDNFPHDRQEKWRPPASAKPLCTQYIEWLFPNDPFKVTISSYNKHIDIRMRGGEIYLFRAPGFFYFNNPKILPEFDDFRPEEYAVDYCMQHGAFRATTMQVIAFYYTKILPRGLKHNLYIHKMPIEVPFFDGLNVSKVNALTNRVQAFLQATPHGAMGIALAFYPHHDMVLVFDALNQRLELYEPNGINEKYHQEKGFLGPLQHFTMYEYLKQHAFEMFDVMDGRVTHIWGNTFKFQQTDSSCSLWASTMAICRMSGVSRDRLPVKTQDVIGITALNRSIMWNVCKFDRFNDLSKVLFESIDRALNDCQVPQAMAQELLAMVLKHQDKCPIPIPPDEPLDEEMKAVPEVPEAEVAPRPLVINLQEVDVNSYFVSYIDQYRKPGPVVVRGTTVAASASALRLLLPQENLVRLELSEPIDLSDFNTAEILKELVLESPAHRITANEAVVFGANTIDILKGLEGQVRFDRVILAKPIQDEDRASLKMIADALVVQPRTWVLTLNLLDVDAMDRALKLPSNSVDKITCTGPLVGQEPPDYALNGPGGPGINQLQLLMDKSTVVEVPSADVRVVVNAFKGARNGHTLHVTEVRAIPTMQDRLHAFRLSSSYIDVGIVSIERLVLTPSAPGVPVFQNFVGEFAKNQPLIPTYMVLDPLDQHSMQTAAALGVSNFLVDQRYASDPPIRLREFLARAKNVIYREFKQH